MAQRDRTAEFWHRREEAARLRCRERFYAAEASFASSQTTTAATETQQRGSGVFEWLRWAVGGAKSAEPSSADSKSSSSSSDGCCSACGKPLQSGRRRCRLCRRDHCLGCAQPALGLLGSSDASVLCRACRAVVSGDAQRTEFRRRVEAAALAPLAELCARVRETRLRAHAEMEKFAYLAGSVVETDFASESNRATAGDVYTVVLEQQRITGNLLRSLEELLKKLPHVGGGVQTTEARLATGVRNATTEVLSSMLLEWRRLSEKLSGIELQTVTAIYVGMLRCRMEAKDNRAFDALFGKKLSATLQTISREMHRAATDVGADWKAHLRSAEDRVVRWDTSHKSLISDEPSAVLATKSTSANAAGTEGRMMRRAMEVFQRYIKDIDANVGFGKLPETRHALAGLIDAIQAEFDV